MSLRKVCALGVFLLVPLGVRSQTVRIVDAAVGGGGALQRAVDLSAPADILVIRAGEYSRTRVTRGLHLLADAGARCHQLLVQGIPAGEMLAVVGLDLVGIPATQNLPDDAPLRVEACSGTVFFAAASVTGRQDQSQPWQPFLAPQAAPAVRVEGAVLHAEHATFTGVNGQNSATGSPPPGGYYWLPGAALSAKGARVTLSACTLTGGGGSTHSHWSFACTTHTGQWGQPAVVASGSTVTLDASSLRGGSGGAACCNMCVPCSVARAEAGSGGSAVFADSGSVALCTGTSNLVTGVSGRGPCGLAASLPAIGGSAASVFVAPAVTLVPGPGAPPIDPSHQVHTGTMPSLTIASPRATVGTPADWLHRAAPGSWAFFFLGVLTRTSIPHPVVLGGIDIDPGIMLVFGPHVVPPSGQLSFGFQVPPDPVLRGGRLFVQSVGVDAALVAAAPPVTGLFVNY